MSTAKAQKEGPALLDAVTGVAALVLIAAILVIGLQILFFVMQDREVEAKTAAPTEFTELEAAQKAELSSGTRWVDQEKGVAGLSVDDAMQAVIRKYGS